MARLASRLARILVTGLALLVVLALLAAGGFRLAASLRETQDPVAAAGPGALFVKADWLDMHYQTWGPDDGQPLLLVHGTLSWAGTWAGIAEPLAARGYRVIAPDMPPFGFSQKPADGDYSRPASARRLRAFVDALSLKHFTLAVHSYGGGPALEFAFAEPEQIDGLILLDVALGLQREGPTTPPAAALLAISPVRNTLMASTFSNPLMIGYGLRDFVFDDDLIDADRIALYARPNQVKGTTEAIGNWFVSGLFGDPKGTLSDDLANYRAFARPVLIIWGEEDKTTPLDQGRYIAKAFPDAQLEILPDVDHIPQLENPQLTVEMVDRFLKALPRRQAAPRPDAMPTAATPAAQAIRPLPLAQDEFFLRGTID